MRNIKKHKETNQCIFCRTCLGSCSFPVEFSMFLFCHMRTFLVEAEVLERDGFSTPCRGRRLFFASGKIFRNPGKNPKICCFKGNFRNGISHGIFHRLGISEIDVQGIFPLILGDVQTYVHIISCFVGRTTLFLG